MLTGKFTAVPNSPGAGNIVYRLRVTNSSKQGCFVTGIPSLTLLDRLGHKLATKARFGGRPGTLAAVVAPLAPGAAATLTARFSPDIRGIGEPVSRACEPTAYRLRVAPSGGGAVVVAVSPPTPVCGHGSMALTVFVTA
jgi:hypothetical protein